MRSRFSSLLLALALALAPSAARAADDLILHVRIAPLKTNRPAWEQTQYYSGAIRIADDPRFRTIANLDKRTLTIINKEMKTYSVSTFAELQKKNESNDTRVQKLPGQIRKMVHADVKVNLKPTGKSETIAGYETKEYSFLAPGVMGSVWITEDLDFGPRAADWVKLSPVFGGENSPSGHLEAAIAAKKGVPLRRIVTMEPLPLVTTEVLDVRRAAPPEEMKSVPADFKKVDLGSFKPKEKAAPAASAATPTTAPH